MLPVHAKLTAKVDRTLAGWRICHACRDFLWNNGGDQAAVFAALD